MLERYRHIKMSRQLLSNRSAISYIASQAPPSPVLRRKGWEDCLYIARHGLFETPSLWFGTSLTMSDIDNTAALSLESYIIQLRSARQLDLRDSSRHSVPWWLGEFYFYRTQGCLSGWKPSLPGSQLRLGRCNNYSANTSRWVWLPGYSQLRISASTPAAGLGISHCLDRYSLYQSRKLWRKITASGFDGVHFRVCRKGLLFH